MTHFKWIFWFLLVIKGGSISGINKKPFQYPDCKLGDSLIRSSNIWASTYRMDNGMPHLARLHDTSGAWTADIQDSKQFIAVNLGALHVVTRVLTQASDSIQTSDDGYIVYDMTDKVSRQKEEDLIILRFRTTQENGLILYADGTEGDFISIELRRGQLHLLLNLGSTSAVSGVTHVVGGNILEDGRWHDVIYQRNRTKAKLMVDRRETEFRTFGFFYRFRLNGKIYIGGVDNFNRDGLSVRHGFTGCIDFIRFNGIPVNENVKDKASGYQTNTFTCSVETEMAISFTTKSSSLLLQQPTDGVLWVTFQFKTFDKSVRLLHHQMTESSEVLVGIDQNGFVNYIIKDGQKKIIDDAVQNTDFYSDYSEYTDGLWHTFTMYADSTHANVTVDRNSRVTNKSLAFNTGSLYNFGGNGIKPGFRGCLRNIKVGSTPLDLTSLNPNDVSNVSIGSCDIKDRCIPNPCEHNGICSQDWDIFYCDCSATGYKGAVCHTSAHPLSCTLYSMNKDTNRSVNEVTIDPDGSGPIVPFSVTCDERKYYFPYPVETSIAHNSMALFTVDGYQAPDYYAHKVIYEPDLKGLTEVIENADFCEQYILWKCNNSRLMVRGNSNDGGISQPYGYWVGRTFQNMFYWGGSAPGTYKCACGLLEQGCVSNATTCNCDSGTRQTEDEGVLTQKEFLPVMELYFGDTGTLTDDKIGQFKVGQLKCYGDHMLDNVITFRKTDATLTFETFEGDKAGDIWFQFKTTAKDGVMIHNTGDTDDNFIKITLMERNSIQFSYNTGNGIQILEYRTKNIFSDNKWHTVHVEHNLKQAWLRVDNFPEVVYDKPVDKITRLLDLTEPLTVGAAVDHRDGFVGCMRGLRVNGVLMDMRGAIRNGQVSYGVHEGCFGKCNSSPCFNQGVCIEGYSHYTCNCSHTPFDGRVCSRDVGVHLENNFMIRFDGMPVFERGDFKFIRIGFITRKKRGILLQFRGENHYPYISLEINNNGGVKLFFDIGFERVEVNTPYYTYLANGQPHELNVWKVGQTGKIYMQVDNYETTVFTMGRHFADTLGDSLLKLTRVFIGNNDTNSTYNGFEGCIYRMLIQTDTDTVVYPLKMAFLDPKPDFVTFVPEGAVHKTTCEFEEITHAPDPAEERTYIPACDQLTPPPVVDSGGKHLEDSDLFFSFSRQDIMLDSNITGSLTMTCRVTAPDISVIYYILIRQETSPGSNEFECLAMIDSGSMQTRMLHDNLNTDKEYVVNGSLDKSVTTYPYLSLGFDVLSLTCSDAKDYICEVAYKNSSTEVFQKILTVSTIVAKDGCAIPESLKTENSKEDKSKKGIIGGVTSFVVIVIVAVGCSIFWRKRNKTQGNQSPTPELSATYTSRDLNDAEWNYPLSYETK